MTIGGNSAPIETEHGWLLLYHPYDAEYVYRFGTCLLMMRSQREC